MARLFSIFLMVLMVSTFRGIAQDANIVAMEYYIDSDPGVGNGTSIAFTPGSVIEVDFTVPGASLTPGFHRLVVRVQDENSEWSTHAQRSLFVQNMSAVAPASSVNAIEYFFDTDPGVGNGTAIPVTTGATLNLQTTIPTAALTPGFHSVSVRTQDEDGSWSVTAKAVFLVHASQNIESMEYFLDADPGVGNATPIAITASSEIEHNAVLPTAALPEGTHTVGVRVGRADDFWSETQTATFSVCTPPVPSFSASVTCAGSATSFTDNSTNVADAVYSWDFDGDGNEDDVTTGSTTFSFPSDGTYNTTLTISRFGCTEVFTDAVIVSVVPVANAGVDQNLCTDATVLAGNNPGPGETGTWTIVSGSAVITDPSDPATTVTSIATGTLTLQWMVANTLAGCSVTDEVTIVRTSAPDADFDTDVVCIGAATSFTDNSLNTSGGTYSWDFDNDGTTDSTNPGSTTFTYASAGVHTAKLTIDVDGCVDIVTVPVTVVSVPSADAGTDQQTCDDNTTLAANAPGAGETGTWSIVSGNATIADPGDPASAITNIGSYSTTLEWTVSSDAGGCASSDQVIILSNQPITAGPVSASVAIGESVNRDVHSAATTNPDDILTTTIVTAPTKGTAVVESDGSITYTPDAGTVGSDVVGYEVCNQCNRCGASTFAIDILNNPPVITQPSPVELGEDHNVSLDLVAIISDPNDNLDLSSLQITQQPLSGAPATIDESYFLIVDYTGIFFSGTDELTIQVCDLAGVCSDNVILIQVNIDPDPPVIVYNAVSPNGDGRHDFLELENIEAYPNNRVHIMNRWGVTVFEAVGYDNDQVRFRGTSNKGGGKELPSGTYYYSIDLLNGTSRVKGFFVLKR